MPVTLDDVERRISVIPANDPEDNMHEDVYEGLTSDPKVLPPKYFYDERGSELFETITNLPEYYQTRTEQSILDRIAPEIEAKTQAMALVEYGAGSARKTRTLLNAMADFGQLRHYIPIDVSAEFLRSTAEKLSKDFPELIIQGLTGDFLHPIELPFEDEPRLIAFLGSTIGNLTDDEADEFLHLISDQMTENHYFLLGTDLEKDVAVLERAYNDSQGITAEFNLNVLRVLNKTLSAEFDLDQFRHHAFYNRDESQIEMHLISEQEQEVAINDLDVIIPFEKNESIRTEISCKYTRNRVEKLLDSAGLELTEWYTDKQDNFALSLSRLQSSSLLS